MSGLSKNVMNMKFMQKAGRGSEANLPAEETKKVKDTSEWELPTKNKIQKTLKPAIKVSTIGYGSIASLTQESKEEEKPKKCKSADTLSTSASNNEKGDEAKKFLEEILGDSKKRNKRPKKENSFKNKKFKA